MGAQETLINGVVKLYLSEENSQDTCIQLHCVEYMKNFYNDHAFKAN